MNSFKQLLKALTLHKIKNDIYFFIALPTNVTEAMKNCQLNCRSIITFHDYDLVNNTVAHTFNVKPAPAPLGH